MTPALKLYFRRCHICNQLTQNLCKDESDLTQCVHCQKDFVPFLFFNDEKTPIFSDNEPRPEIKECYLPIRGFTSYW